LSFWAFLWTLLQSKTMKIRWIKSIKWDKIA
jgi:hypothetical protein